MPNVTDLFASPGYSLGGRKKQVLTQATSYDPAHPEDAATSKR